MENKYLIVRKEENIPEDRENIISLVVGKNAGINNFGKDKVLVLTEVSDIPEKLPGKTDIIVSWVAPLSFPPILEREEGESYEKFEKRKMERKKLDEFLKTGRHTWWFYPSDVVYSGNYGELKYRGLKETSVFKL